MKNKSGLILLLIIISIVTVSCSGDKLERANEYMTNGNIKGAEKLYKKVLLEESNQEAYEGLIKIYSDTDQMKELAEIVSESMEKGYTPEINEVYINIIDYYDSIDDRGKVMELIGETFSEISLPISAYKKYLLKDELPEDMDIIEMKCGDITNNNMNEIVVILASPQEGINMNYYEKIQIHVYNLQGKIIYEDYQDGGYWLYPKVSIVDLNNDGVKDLYYNAIYDSITNAHTIAKVVSLKDNNIEFLYSDGIKELDIKIETIDKNFYTIYSEKMEESYDILLREPLEEGIEPIWWEIYEKLVKDENGKCRLQTNFEIKGYGKIQVDHDYIDGQIRPVTFKIEPYKGTVQVERVSKWCPES